MKEPEAGGTLSVSLSSSLYAQMKRSAEDEGVSVEALATELLAEGVVLRAWEIIQRNSAMRAPSTGGGASGNAGAYGNRGGNPNPPGRNNTAWMEDKAAFLDYVRNQEKRRR